jgi:hypothetical protein
MKRISIIVLLLLTAFLEMYSQKGEPPPEKDKFNPDSVFIFNSPRPLITPGSLRGEQTNGWGFDLVLSNNGFGGGLFWQQFFNSNFLAYASLYLTGARNTDEFEYYFYDPNTGRVETKVPNKINRLYMFPLTFGLQQYLFTDVLTESFRPYVAAAIGPTFILSTPYEREFFNAFGHASLYTRFGASIGVGSDVSGIGTNVLSINLRYYYIPFGGNGLESIRDNPIHNFGGIFLSLSIGMRY